MTSAKYDITIGQGATFRLPLVLKNDDDTVVDLTGYSARMQIRSIHSAFTTLVSLASHGGGITITAETGAIEVLIAAEETAGMPPIKGVYDFELIQPNDEVWRLLEGSATITPEVTRP